MIPWYGLTLLGTTDTDFKADAEQVNVDDSDIDYLLAAANHYLKVHWSRADIVGSFVGVRVFKQFSQATTPASPSALSRDWELRSTSKGVHYAIGGKITSSRQDAARIVDAVCAQLGITATCATAGRLFPWAPQQDFIQWRAAMQNQAIQLGIDAQSAHWLLHRHGTRVTEIFHAIETQADLAQRIMPSLPFIYADLIHCAATEMVIHLDDLLRRRMPLLILTRLTRDQLLHIGGRVASTMHWDNTRTDQEIERCQQQWGIQ